MKNLFLLICLLVAVAFSLNSCSKDDGGDDNNGSGNNSGKLVKTVNYDNGDDVYHFTYDSQRRLTKYVNTWGGQVYKSSSEASFIYDDSERIIESWDDGRDWIYTLDANGYVIRQEWEVEAGYTNIPMKEEYAYSNGQLIQAIDNDNRSTTYIWEDGNVIKSKHETYTYTDKENKLNINLASVVWFDYNPFSDECFLKFKGTSPKNLPASLTSLNEDGSSYTETLSYEFDSEGYPTKIVIGPEGATITITYY